MAGRASTLRNVVLPAGIVLITAAVYSNTLGFGFVYDDWARIASWHDGAYYRPVFQLWLRINLMLFKANPWGWHVSSVLVHLAATFLVYRLAWRIAADRMAAALTAALFGLHPAHIEAIDWPSAITDPLATVFFVSAFLCYLKAKDTRSFRWRAAALLFYALGVFENEVCILLPALLFSYEWIFGAKSPGLSWRFAENLGACFPFLGVAAVYFAVRLQVMHGWSAAISPAPFSDVVMTWPSMLVFYAKHLVWPFPLTLFYVVPAVTRFTMLEFWIPLEIVLAAAAVIWFGARELKAVVFGGIWVLLTLMPVLDFRVFAHNENVHDRYLYLPSIGFCLIAAVTLHEILTAFDARRPTAARAAIVSLLLGLMAFGTIRQSGQWSDNYSLFRRALDVSPNNEIANQGMGAELFLRRSYIQSAQYYRRALDLQPSLPDATYGVARCYLELDLISESEPYFARAIQLRPEDPKTYLYFGIARTKQNRLQDAEALIRDAIRRKGPDDFSNYHASLAEVLKRKGDLQGALSEYRAELRENPSSQIADREIAMLEAQLKFANK
ncbi:MAG TPA: tetratricopeptide repeat protein [Bryobacteraceae bacterium]